MIKFIWFIPVFAVVISCGTRYEAEIKEIDSLLVLIDSAQSMMKKVSHEVMQERHEYCNEQFKTMQGIKDTLSRDEALLIDRFGGMCKAYRKWSGKYDILYDDLQTIPIQLKNLKKDLSKNLIEDSSAVKYLNAEREATSAIVQTISQMKSGLESIEKPFLETDQKVINLMEQLKSTEPASIES